jgi:hypothetical protein
VVVKQLEQAPHVVQFEQLHATVLQTADWAEVFPVPTSTILHVRLRDRFPRAQFLEHEDQLLQVLYVMPEHAAPVCDLIEPTL